MEFINDSKLDYTGGHELSLVSVFTSTRGISISISRGIKLREEEEVDVHLKEYIQAFPVLISTECNHAFSSVT